MTKDEAVKYLENEIAKCNDELRLRKLTRDDRGRFTKGWREAAKSFIKESKTS